MADILHIIPDDPNETGATSAVKINEAIDEANKVRNATLTRTGTNLVFDNPFGAIYNAETPSSSSTITLSTSNRKIGAVCAFHHDGSGEPAVTPTPDPKSGIYKSGERNVFYFIWNGATFEQKISNSGFNYITEAPNDGNQYGRQNEAWTVVSQTPQFTNTKSGSFNGASSKVVSGSNLTSLDFSGVSDKPFSIAFWTKVTQLTTTQAIIGNFNPVDNSDYQWQLLKLASNHGTNPNGYSLQLRNQTDNTGLSLRSSISVTDSQWVFIVATYDGSELDTGLEIYVDSVLDAAPDRVTTGAFNGLEATVATSRIYNGCRDIGSGDSNFSQGGIDEVSVWSKALNQTEINALYNSGTPTDLTGMADLQLWIRYEDNVNDESPNGYNFTPSNLTYNPTDLP